MSAVPPIERLYACTDPAEMETLLAAMASMPGFDALVEMYRSIWKMTYANVPGNEFSGLSLAGQMALLNEQENLVPAGAHSIEAVTHLDLGGFPDAIFFPELLRYTGIRRLDFWENDLAEVPVDLYRLDSLEALYFGDGVAVLPEGIGQLHRLRYLHVTGQLETLPADLAQLARLETLELAGNRLAHIPFFLCEMPSLKTLDLRFNPGLQASEPFRRKCAENGTALLI